jgi:hypothetical protein
MNQIYLEVVSKSSPRTCPAGLWRERLGSRGGFETTSEKGNGAATRAAPPAKGRYIIAYISEGLPREAPLKLSAGWRRSLEYYMLLSLMRIAFFLFSHYFYYFFSYFQLARH